MRDDLLNDIKEVIYNEERYGFVAHGGLFFSRNIAGDIMENVASFGNGVEVDVCRNYDYFEVFGLTKEEQKSLSEWYY